jgi:protein SCO1/2
MMRLLLLLLLALTTPAWAAPEVAGLGFYPHPGAALPLDAAFTDDNGRAVHLGDVLQGRPVILALGYYHCPNLCGVVRADLFSALANSGLRAGADYSVVALSIDPAETAKDATSAKAGDLALYATPGAATAWHFLTGRSETVQQAVGYTSRWDDRLKQFMHPVGVVVATPGGIVSSYVLGVGYTPQDLRAAVRAADLSRVVQPLSPILLLCFHFDPTTGRYSLAILRVLQLAGVFTVLVIGGLLAALRWRPQP